VFNWGLDARIRHYEDTGETLSHYTQDKALTQLKRDPDHDWLSETPRRCLWYALKGLDEAYKHFFRRVKKGGEAPGFPRFKAKGRSSTSFTFHGTDVRIEEKRIRLPVLGWVRLKEKGYLPVNALKYMECTVSERAGRWYVSITAEVPDVHGPPATGPALAAHPGVRSFLTLRDDDGREERHGNRRALGAQQKRIGRLQRKLARQTKGGANREKTKALIAKTHAKVSDKRSDATHKATHRATHGLRPSSIVIQKWRVKEMLMQKTDLPKWLERKIKRSISDANLSEIVRQIQYKAQWAGSEVIELEPEHPVSRTCSRCRSVKSDLGMEQIYRCDACGLEMDRETNATLNMLAAAVETEPA